MENKENTPEEQPLHEVGIIRDKIIDLLKGQYLYDVKVILKEVEEKLLAVCVVQ